MRNSLPAQVQLLLTVFRQQLKTFVYTDPVSTITYYTYIVMPSQY